MRLSIAVLSFGATLAIFHAGVEYGLWQGPAFCSGSTVLANDGKDLLQILQHTASLNCRVAQWTFAGISLAGYNALLSIDACIFACMLVSGFFKKE